ncbi:MAG: hypothetical protein QXO30_01910 [Candidatus Caldarchaeum sp.]
MRRRVRLILALLTYCLLMSYAVVFGPPPPQPPTEFWALVATTIAAVVGATTVLLLFSRMRMTASPKAPAVPLPPATHPEDDCSISKASAKDEPQARRIVVIDRLSGPTATEGVNASPQPGIIIFPFQSKLPSLLNFAMNGYINGNFPVTPAIWMEPASSIATE